MAQRQIVELVDDLDGTSSDDIATVYFGLDGVDYEIDLNAENAEKLRAAMQGVVGAGRRVGGRLKRGTATATPSAAGVDRERNQAIRAWAREQGHEVSERGRIPEHVVEAFDAAQAAPRKRGGRSKNSAPAFSS